MDWRVNGERVEMATLISIPFLAGCSGTRTGQEGQFEWARK